MLQALLEQVKKDAVLLQSKQAEIDSKDDKIQALTYELAYLRSTPGKCLHYYFYFMDAEGV
jgi:ribosome assembly protein YihI (activator of Der GTPase)